MSAMMKRMAVCSFLAMSTGIAIGDAAAQNYPAKTVRIVVGSAAGGPIDLVGRLTAQKLSEAFDQQFVVENRVGAGGTIAGEYVAKGPRDGYVLSMGSAATLCIAPALYPRLPYDPVADFSPISVIAGTAFVMVLHPSIPARSVKEFVALAKAKPGQLRFGSAGSGSGTHLSAELFKSMANINVLHIPYKGGSQAIIDVLSGQIDFMFDTVPNSSQHVKSGKLRGLGVTSAQRSALMPDVPTIAEAGIKGYEATTWFGLLGPAGVPRDVVTRVSGAARKALATDEFRQRLLAQGLEPIGNTPEQFAELIKLELPKWAKVVRSSNARTD